MSMDSASSQAQSISKKRADAIPCYYEDASLLMRICSSCDNVPPPGAYMMCDDGHATCNDCLVEPSMQCPMWQEDEASPVCGKELQGKPRCHAYKACFQGATIICPQPICGAVIKGSELRRHEFTCPGMASIACIFESACPNSNLFTINGLLDHIIRDHETPVYRSSGGGIAHPINFEWLTEDKSYWKPTFVLPFEGTNFVCIQGRLKEGPFLVFTVCHFITESNPQEYHYEITFCGGQQFQLQHRGPVLDFMNREGILKSLSCLILPEEVSIVAQKCLHVLIFRKPPINVTQMTTTKMTSTLLKRKSKMSSD